MIDFVCLCVGCWSVVIKYVVWWNLCIYVVDWEKVWFVCDEYVGFLCDYLVVCDFFVIVCDGVLV